MKRIIALLLILICVLGLVGCAAGFEVDAENRMAGRESIKDNTTDLPTETTNDVREIHDTTPFVVEIYDRTCDEPLVCAEATELFYEDETTYYWFNVIKSQYIIVTYSDGETDDVKTAFNAGRITIADLDRFGIEYTTELKNE